MISLSPRQPGSRAWLAAGAALGVGLLSWWLLAGREQKPEGPGEFDMWNAPVPVRTVAAKREDLSVQLKAIGTITPLNSVTVRSRVDGALARVLFKEGERVEAGQLLAEIDPEPYRVRLAQAQGQQQQNLAQLENAEADLALYQRLIEQGSIARQQLDKQQALVNQLRGTLKADQAQVDNAALQLSYTRITAPIGGRLGLRRVDAGNLVNSTDTAGLVTIAQTRPINVVFTIPEAELPLVREQFGSGQPLAVEVWDRADRRRLAEGRLTTFDNQIDINTGTVRLKAQFGNDDDALFPNQFVNVRLHVHTLADVVTVPADAVQFGSRSTYVYSIRDNKAYMREVGLGATVDGRVVVNDGLAAGDQIVLEGLDRLRDGRDVAIENPAAPAAPVAKSDQREG